MNDEVRGRINFKVSGVNAEGMALESMAKSIVESMAWSWDQGAGLRSKI